MYFPDVNYEMLMICYNPSGKRYLRYPELKQVGVIDDYYFWLSKNLKIARKLLKVTIINI